jgi:hypothetical protein
MKHLKTSKEMNESSKNISNVMINILNDLEYEKKDYEETTSYMDEEYYM